MSKNTKLGIISTALLLVGFGMMHHGGMNCWEMGGVFFALWGYGVQEKIK